MDKKTKIIATVGPATWTKEKIKDMYEAGVNIIRFNFSHADFENATRVMDIIRDLNNSGETNLSTLLDTKGPEIRSGDVDEKINYTKGDKFKIVVDEAKNDGGNTLFCDYEYLLEDMKVGDVVRIDSGLFDAIVLEVNTDHLLVEAMNDALIGSRRHINLPGVKLKLPGVTDEDKKSVGFAIEQNYDFIAMSFVRNKENIAELREFLDSNGGEHIKIISKVENQESIENIDEIVKHSDGVMVARGDLGIEVPIEDLPIYQKQIVRKSKEEGKFVIVATHLLETMIDNPFPTRAEVSDIYNSVAQKADSIMLSGETAIGQYPIEAIKMMTQVIKQAEANIHYKHWRSSDDGLSQRDIEKKHLIRSSIYVAEELDAKAILILTRSGRLGRLASSFRPNSKVYAFTMEETSKRYMNALFGITPEYMEFQGSRLESIENAVKHLLDKGEVTMDDKLIAVADINKKGKEIPVMEIVYVRDLLTD